MRGPKSSIEEKGRRRQTETDEDLHPQAADEIGIDAETHAGREKSDFLLPFANHEIADTDGAGEDPDKKG